MATLLPGDRLKGYSEVSVLSTGDGPTGKEPNPKRRRIRRPGNRSKRARGVAPDDGQTAAVRVAAGNSRDNAKGVARDETVGSGNPSGNGTRKRVGNGNPLSADGRDQQGAAVGEQSQPRNRSGKRRRNRGKRKNRHAQAPNNGELRNVRSIPKPSEDASYSPQRPGEPANGLIARSPQANKPNQKKHRRQHYKQPAPLYAALDLGTNNCRLLVALPQSRGQFRVIDGFSRIVRLGEGLEHTGRLSEEAMDRAIGALKICAGKLSQKKIRKQRLIATEACRQASNGTEFLERVKQETGLDLEIVNRETEARLAAEGCGSLMDRRSDGAVLFDIGGGSSELVLVDSTGEGKKRIADKIVAWTSLPMGVVTLAERFGGRDVNRSLFDEMVQDVMQHIDRFDGREALATAISTGRIHLLGTSGTVTTLAGVHLDLPRYDRRRVDGIWLHNEDIDRVIDRLIEMPFEERAKNPCIGEERADLVLAGCAILNAIRLTWPSQRLRVADRGLREGLLAEMMNKDRVWSRARGRHKPSGHHRGGQTKARNRGGQK